MPNTTKETIVAAIAEKMGVKPAEAKRVLETILYSMKLVIGPAFLYQL